MSDSERRTEADIMREIQCAVSDMGHRVFRNNVAEGWVGVFGGRTPDGTVTLKKARPLHAGLCIGSSDLIGITNRGLFLAIECKATSGHRTPEQIRFVEFVKRMGGLAGFASSCEDAEAIIRGE